MVFQEAGKQSQGVLSVSPSPAPAGLEWAPTGLCRCTRCPGDSVAGGPRSRSRSCTASERWGAPGHSLLLCRRGKTQGQSPRWDSVRGHHDMMKPPRWALHPEQRTHLTLSSHMGPRRGDSQAPPASWGFHGDTAGSPGLVWFWFWF